MAANVVEASEHAARVLEWRECGLAESGGAPIKRLDFTARAFAFLKILHLFQEGLGVAGKDGAVAGCHQVSAEPCACSCVFKEHADHA